MCLVRTVQFQRTNVSAYAPPVFRLFYALLLIRIAAGQRTELLVVYPAKDIVLIQPLEQRIKLRCSFRQFFIFTLLGVKLPSVFRGAFFVDKFRKLPFSSRSRHRSADRNTCSFHLCLSVGVYSIFACSAHRAFSAAVSAEKRFTLYFFLHGRNHICTNSFQTEPFAVL
mgnify:CR=1 FL=1